MIATAFVCLTVLVIAWRAEPYVHRLVTLAEQRTRVAELPKRPALPADLQLLVNAESEGWAQEQRAATLYELYDAHKDWDLVRGLIRG